MEFRVLGELEVVDADQPLALGGSQQRLVLALLLLRSPEAISAERLIDELWGEQPLSRDRLGRAQQQQRQHEPLLRAPQRERLVCSDDLQLSEDSELQCSPWKTASRRGPSIPAGVGARQLLCRRAGLPS